MNELFKYVGYSFNGALTGLSQYVFPGDPLQIQPSQESLRQAIAEKKEDVLKCKIKDHFQTYTPLEYAVKIEDLDSITQLIDLGAPVESGCEIGDEIKYYQTIIFFYIDCISEGKKPNIEILKVLIEKISDINTEEAGLSLTHLEYALQHMSGYNTVHWEVVELFLKHRSRISEEYSEVTPFNILVRYHRGRLRDPMKMIGNEEEKKFLENLAIYVRYEKQYHPESNSGLSMKEFKEFSKHWKMQFEGMISSLSVDKWIADCSEKINNSIAQHIWHEFTEVEKNSFDSFLEYLGEFRIKTSVLQMKKAQEFALPLFQYYSRFSALVNEKEAKFINCFEDWEFNSLREILKNDQFGQIFLKLIEEKPIIN